MSLRLSATLAFTLVGGPAFAANADAIFFGGPILTMNDAMPEAKAVAVKDGRIVAVGPLAEVRAAEEAGATTMEDLHGRTLLPGFIHPHSHFIDSLSLADRVNVSARRLDRPARPTRSSPRCAPRRRSGDAAYQYREEASKGSIELGKRADLVVLSDNPLTVDPMAIKDIKVERTIKDGSTIYSAE
jgi:predicted amidohydrolase YtcJ